MKSLILSALLYTLGLCAAGSAMALDLGKPAPDFSLGYMANGPVGSKLSLSSYKGKVVYVDFWASWCGPCRKSFPALNDIRNKYASQGFEVIAVNVDENPDDGLKFLREIKVDYPVVFDPKGTVPSMYQLNGMPNAFLIDKEGILRHIHIGYRPKDKAKIDGLVKGLL